MAGLTPSRRWITGLALLATLHLLLFYGLPGSIRLAVLIALGIFYFRAGAMAAVATTLSLGVATLFCALAIHLLGLDRSMYYRPHEQLVEQNPDQGHRAYRKNALVDMQMPHGDLKAMTGAALAQPRHVVFRTDSEGFRNDHDYVGGQYVLIGDSYIVGIVDTQQDMLSVQLQRDHGIPAYSLAHPGDISDYLATWRAFRARHPGPVKGVLFLFEGNDFESNYKPATKEKPHAVARWISKYYGLFTATDMRRVTKSLYTRAIKYRSIASSDTVQIQRVGGQDMGFYMPYVNATLRQTATLPIALVQDLVELGGQVEQIFFIPTKYRVYAPHFGIGPLPNAQWQTLSRLCAQQNWRCTDLTPSLAMASDELLKQGEFTWWLDDTHWNRQGMAVAARVVAEQLKSRAPSPSAEAVRPR
jgi:hypothetical protein